MNSKIEFSTSVSLQAQPEKIWSALVQPDIVRQYHLAPLGFIEGKENGKILYGTVEKPLITGRITIWHPFRQLAHSFQFADFSHTGTEADPETLVTYTLHPEGTATTLILLHSGFAEMNQTYQNISGGWPHILDGLKRTVESAS